MASRSDRWFYAGLFLISAFFTAQSAGIVSCNDGSSFALIEAIAHHRTFRIDPYVSLTAMTDVSRRAGHWYTDRAPGTAFLSLPFHAVGQLAEHRVPGTHEQITGFAVTLSTVLAAILSVLLLRQVCLLLGAGRGASAVAALTYALGSTLIGYANVLYVHAWSGATLLLLVYLALRWYRQRGDPGRRALFWTGMAGALAITMEYPNALAVPMVGLLVWGRERREGRSPLRAVAALAAGLAVGAIPLAGYNTLCFGAPWVNSYKFQYHVPWARTFSDTFAGNPIQGFLGLMILPPTGLLLWSPILFLALAAWARKLREAEPAAWMVAGITFLVVALISFHRGWFGGGTHDTRYIHSITALFFIGVAFWLDGARDERENPRERQPELFLLFGAMLALTLLLRLGWETGISGGGVGRTLSLKYLVELRVHPSPALVLQMVEHLVPHWKASLAIHGAALLGIGAWMVARGQGKKKEPQATEPAA